MEIYVEQMEAITELLKVLIAWEEKHGDEIRIGNNIPLYYAQADDSEGPYGHLVDEIGGVWAFRPHNRLRDVQAGAQLTDEEFVE